MTDLESRLAEALADTARRNLADDERPPRFQPPEPARAGAGRWLLPAVAAALVVAVAVGLLIGVNRWHRDAPAATNRSAESGSVITLGVAGGGRLSPSQLGSAARSVADRAVALGFSGATATVEGDDLSLLVPGVQPTDARLKALPGLGAVGELQFRPLLAEPVRPASAPTSSSGRTTSPAGQPRVDPWRSLGFTPPTDAAALAALPAARRQAVQAVLAAWDCGNLSVDPAGAAILACDQTGDQVYLLGPAITSGDVSGADSFRQDGRQWVLNISLKPDAQQRWTDYTARHNESEHPGAVDNVVADVLDGRVTVASTVMAQITGVTQLTGDFDQATATTLAAVLAHGPLPAAFTVVSVGSR